MPDMETAHRTQDAVFWARNGYDRNGEPKVDAPVDIKVRWQIKRGVVRDPFGNTIEYDSLAVVDREITNGSLMWLGTIATLPATVTNLREVVFYSESKNIKGRATRRVVHLMKYSNTIAASA